MSIPFYKYQASGNDFILIDDRKQDFPLSAELVQFLCDRHFGIGSDGLILLQNHKLYDFEMLFFNPDGSSGSMCGNGGRCIALFAFNQFIVIDDMQFQAPDGPHSARIIKNDLGQFSVALSMSPISKIQEFGKDYFIDTGAPHYVVFTKDIHEISIIEKGRKIRYSKQFQPIGTNVNFVETLEQKVFLRTYEKGVEDETLSCGTGVTATAIAIAKERNMLEGTIEIISKGGTLNVSFKTKNETFDEVVLHGPVEFVFEGSIEL